MTDIQLQCTPGPGQFGGYSVFITDDHIRAIVERAKEMGLLPSVVKESLTVQPAAPADDEATVAFIAERIRGWNYPEAAAREVFSAIRRGEVPGLPSPDEHAKLIECFNERGLALAKQDTEIDTLKAEVERLRAELKEANYWRHNYADSVKTVEAERDAAIARAEKLDSELGAHKASRIAYASEFDGDVGSIHQNIRAMKKDLGAAHAAHAEAMELLERWREKSHPMNFGRSISEDTRAYLDKYGKDASK